MVAIVRPDEADGVATALETAGEIVHRIGEVVDGEKGCTVRGSAETWSARDDWTATHHG